MAIQAPRKLDLPLDFPTRISIDDKVAFTLPDGQKIACDEPLIERDEKGVVMVQGTFTEPAKGSFFFRRQDFEGIAGKMVGHVIFDDEKIAWKVLPEGKGGDPILKEVTIDEVICVKFMPTPENPQEMPQDHPSTVALPEYQEVIPLQSLPGAPGTIYLDFDGEKGSFQGWSYKDARPSGLSNASIRDIWIRVAEDFLPFNLNVTTDVNVWRATAQGRRIRCMITPTYTGGGVAFVGSFNSGGEPTCWSNNYSGDSAATVISHEVGHTLGLLHHGYNGAEYYGGHGSGATAWAPIMGVGYGKTLKHWSDGSYYLATRKNQKDLTTITNQNGVDFRPDDCGDALASARYLWIGPGNTVTNQQGLITTPGDIDSFRFKTTGGAVNLTASTTTIGINLDIKADIVNSATGALVFTSDSTSAANATISTTLAAGEYLLRITGASVGTPATSQGGYSNYGSLGSYKISGTVAGGETHQAFTIAENSANGTVIGTITPRTVTGSPLSYAIASGNTGNILALNPSTGALTVANSASLNFETLSSQYDDPALFELFVTVTNTSTFASETVRSIVTVTDVNEPPVLAAIPSAITVYEGTTPGAPVVDLSATDPDRFDGPVYEIVSGNSAGYFAINSRTGALTVANVPQVATNTTVTLELRARDQKTPTQYSVIRTLIITITDLPGGGPGTPGSIVRTFFRNISGSAVSDLTGNASFPNKPDEEVFFTSFDGGSSVGDNYGSTLRGYLIPPVSGEYRFWIAGDDASQLILGSGSSQVSTPVIASHTTSTGQYAWDAQSSQASAPVTLTAGQPYYIEARQKEASGGDHVAVAWSGPGIARQLIPGLYLVPFYQNYAPTPSGTFAVMETAAAGTVVGTVGVADVNKQDSHDNFTITAGNTGNVFAINPTNGQITVATAGLFNANTTPFYNLTIRTTDDGMPALNGSGTVRININASQLYFDPNGTASGSVADAGSYGWRTTSWATAAGGTAAVANWIPNAQAIFSATTPLGPLSYDVDIASYNSGTHGGFGAIRALGGTVRFVGNVDNYYLVANTAVEAAPGAAIEFNQTRSGNALLAFNLNSQTVTFDGQVTFNNGGMGNLGNVVVNSGKLALNAANPYTGSTTVNNGTLSLLGSGAIYTTLNWANQTVSLNPGTTLELDRWVGTNRSLGQLGYAAQNLVIDGATVRNVGLTNPLVTDDSPGLTIGTNGATLESATTGQMWRILTDNRNAAFGIVSNGGPLTLTGAGDGSITKNLSGTTTALIKTGTGTWNLGGTNTYGGGTTVSAGTLQCNNTASLPGAATVESNSSDESKFGTLFMNAPFTTWSQDVSGSGLWKVATGSGSQTTVLSGNYTAFNGTLEVATGSGKIQLANAANYPAAGSTIQLNPNTTLYLAGGGTLQSDFRLFGGTIGEPSYGQLRVGAASAILNGDITLHANSTIAADSSRTATINGVIGESGGSFGFTKNQPGVLVLTNNNTHTGGTTVSAGTLQTGTSTGNLGPGNLTIASGATCQIRNTTGALGRQAYIYLNGTGKLDLANGVNEQVARLYVGGVLQAAGTYTAGNLSSNISGAGSLIVGEVVPDAPTDPTATLASWNAVRLNWSHIAVNATSVRVERSLSPTSGFTEIANLGPGTSTCLDPNLAVLTPYHYRIRVSNPTGFSAYSEVASVTTRAADPPAGFAAVAGNAQVSLSWSASDGATSYRVNRGTESGGPYTIVGTTAATSFTDTTVANGTEYYYIVLAIALGAESDPSDEVSARPLPPTGTGVWAADSGGNWSDVDNWQNFVVADGGSNSASFGRTAGGTVTVDSVSRTLGTLNFSAGDYVLTGFPLALDAGAGIPAISVANNRIATIEPLIASTNGLRKTGGGSLCLTNGSSYTASTSIDGGTLALKGSYAGSEYVIASGAVLEIDSSAGEFSLPVTTFSGTGTLRKSGPNRIFWGTSAATFALGSGSLIEVSGGTFVGGSNSNEVWTNNKSDLSVASGAVFDGVEANVRVDGLSGSGTVRTGYSGAGYSYFAVGVDNGSSTFSGVIADRSAAGNLRKEGTGTITLSGSNSFTGGVNLISGNLRITRSSGLGSGTKTVTINSGTDKFLELDGSGGNITLGSGITYQTSGANGVFRNIAGNNTIAGAITMTAGNGNTRVVSDGGTLTLSGSITANTSGRLLDLGGSSTGNNTVSGVIGSANTPAVAKNGPGTWVLSGNNTYGGTTTVSEGTLTLTANRSTSLGAAVAVGNTADKTAILNIQGDLPFAGQEFGVGSTADGATGIVNHSAGLVSFNSGNALLIGRSTGGVSGTYHLSGGELRSFSSTSRGIMIGVNDGAAGNPINASFILSGTGFINNATGALQVVRSDSTSSYQNSTYQQTGGTSSHGTLVIGGNAASGANSTAEFSITGGTFTATTFGNLSRGNNVVSTLTIGGTADVTLPAFPTSRGTSSTATLHFDGGTLRPTAASTTYLGGLTAAWIGNGGASFDVPASRDITVSQLFQASVGSSGGLTKSGSGVLTLSGASTYAGPTTVNGGSLVAGSAAKLGNSHLTVNNAASCDLRNPAGAIADAAHVHLNGTGRLIIASGVAETVARLYVNQVLQAAGTYTSTSHPALVSGAGSLVVTTSAPLAPTGLVATTLSNTSIGLTWSDNTGDDTGYMVERSSTAGSGFSQIAALPTNATSHVDAALAGGTTWFYRVRASGGISNSSYSNEASATTLPDPPAAPASPSATAGGFAVRLDWAASANATGYRIRRSSSAGSGFSEIGTATGTSFIDSGLPAGVPVFYRIAAENGGGLGVDSVEVSATPLSTLQWDRADTTTAGAQGGSGSWNSAPNWWNGFQNSSWPSTGMTNEAIFGGSSGTVTLDAAGLSANRLSFATTGYLLQSGPLTLNGTEPTLNIPSGFTATISSPIRGTAGWVKSGPGTLALSGASSFTGNLAAIAGNLQFATGLSLDPAAVIQLGDVSGTENATISWNNNSLTTHLPMIVRSGSAGNKSVSVSSGVTSSIASLEINDHLTKIGSGTLTVTGSTTLKGGNRILGTDAGNLTLGGVLSSVGGIHGLTKSGAGILRLNGDNIGYNGAVVLNQGSLHVGHANALGRGAFTNSLNSNTLTNVSGSAIVLSNSSYSIGSNLTVGGSNSAADIHTGPGAFSLTGSERIVSISGGVKLELGGNFSGNLRKDGTGSLVLGGTGTGAGSLRVTSGVLQLTGSLAPTTSLILGHNTTGTSLGTFMLGGSSGAVNQTIASLQSSGAAQAGQKVVGGHSTISTLTVNLSSDATYAGSLGGVGPNENKLAFIKSGTGTLTLSGTSHTHSGPTTVSGGRLVLAGSLAADLTASGGSIVPQGTLSIGGGLSISAGGKLEMSTTHSLVVAGPVNLSGGLELSAPAGLTVGQSFTLIQKSASSPVTGTFNTLPESSLFQAAGYDWQISYAGGDGNDVVVTVRPVSPAEQWRLTHFGSIANAGIGADNQDPDQDGVINLLERAFALNPLGHDTAGVPSSPIEAGVFSLVYRQSRAASDLDFVVEISPDLSAGSWRAAVLAPAENADGSQVIADDSLPDVQIHRFTTLPGQKGFYRIRVD